MGARKWPVLSLADERRVLRTYLAGFSLRETGNEHGISHRHVEIILGRLGHRPREPQGAVKFTVCPVEGCDAPCDDKELLALVRDLGAEQTANLLMLNRKTVYNRRKRAMGRVAQMIREIER